MPTAHGTSLPCMDRRAVTSYLRHEVEEWIRSGRTITDLAKAVGVAGPSISQLRSGRNGAGLSMIGGFARVLGISMDELVARAAAHAQEHPLPPVAQTQVVRDDRYPNRAKALQAAELLGYSAEARAVVAGMALRSSVDPSPDEWLDEVRREDRRLRLGIGQPAAPTAEEQAEAEARTKPPGAAAVLARRKAEAEKLRAEGEEAKAKGARK